MYYLSQCDVDATATVPDIQVRDFDSTSWDATVGTRFTCTLPRSVNSTSGCLPVVDLAAVPRRRRLSERERARRRARRRMARDSRRRNRR